jgi:hypothetical protein
MTRFSPRKLAALDLPDDLIAQTLRERGAVEVLPTPRRPQPNADGVTMALTIDGRDTGQRVAALDCSGRWTAAGRKILHLLPNTIGADVNNLM